MELNEDWFDKTKSTQITLNQILNDNEKVLWKGCPKKSSYALSKSLRLMPMALLWALVDFGIILFLIIVYGNTFQAYMIAILIPFFIVHLTPFWMWLFKVLKSSSEMKNTYYLITNQRVICIKGKIPYVDNSLEIKDLKYATLSRDSIDKLLHVGDIFLTSITGVIVLYDIPDCEFMTQRLNKLISNKDKEFVFYKETYVCNHCGSAFDAKLNKCPNCGASKEKTK